MTGNGSEAVLYQFDSLFFVIAGLVPAISILVDSRASLNEMAGTSLAMTSRAVLK
jgi:hypothetical protein